MISRRDLLKALPTSTVLLGAQLQKRRQNDREGDILTYELFFDEADLPRIQNLFLTDDRFSSVRDEILSIDIAAERASLQDVKTNDQLAQIIRLSRLVENSAFRYLMTGETEVASLCVEAIRTIMNFERWDIYMDGPDSIGVQRSPEATLAVVTAIDWLGNFAGRTERKSWMRKLGDAGCEACYRALHDMVYPQDAEGWRFDPESTFFDARPDDQHDLNRRAEIISDTNLRALPAGAITAGAVAYQKEFGTSENTNRWLEMGTYSIDVFRDFFGADGSWNEEVHYANYTALHLVKGALALVRSGGPNLLDVVNWDGYWRFLMHMSNPTTDDRYGVVNFGDSGNRPGYPHTFTRAALPAWVASQLEDEEAQWFAMNLAGTHTIWSVIWSDLSLAEKQPADIPTLWVSSFDRVVARDGWSEDDLVVAMRSGPPANHEHADRNSIIVKAFGQVLVTDPLRPPYGYAHPAWQMRLTQGHSAVLVDGHGHEHHNGVEGTNASRSFARISASELNRTSATWTSVATQPYRLVDIQIKDVIRSVAVLFDENVVVIADYLSKFTGSSALTVRYFGDNADGNHQQSIVEGGFRRSRPGAIMNARIFSRTPFTVEEGVPFVPAEFAEPHPFVDIQTKSAEQVLVVSALSFAPEGAQTTAVNAMSADGGYDMEIGSRQLRVMPGRIEVG